MIRQWFPGIRKCGHIIGGAKFRKDSKGITFLFFKAHDLVPPGQMRFYGGIPFWRTGIINLWTFRMTNPRMNMIHTLYG